MTIFVTVGPFMNVVLRYQKEIQTEQQDYLYSVCFQVNSDALQEIWGIINLNFYNIIIVLSTIDDEQFNLHSI